MVDVLKPRRHAPRCYVIAITHTEQKNIPELASLTADTTRGRRRRQGQTERANARNSGEREASDVSRFPAFIHAYRWTSNINALPHIINPQIIRPAEGTPRFHDPYPRCSARMSNSVTLQHASLHFLSVVFRRLPQPLPKGLHFSIAHFGMRRSSHSIARIVQR